MNVLRWENLVHWFQLPVLEAALKGPSLRLCLYHRDEGRTIQVSEIIMDMTEKLITI